MLATNIVNTKKRQKHTQYHKQTEGQTNKTKQTTSTNYKLTTSTTLLLLLLLLLLLRKKQSNIFDTNNINLKQEKNTKLKLARTRLQEKQKAI